jgi:hypothetical protein
MDRFFGFQLDIGFSQKKGFQDIGLKMVFLRTWDSLVFLDLDIGYCINHSFNNIKIQSTAASHKRINAHLFSSVFTGLIVSLLYSIFVLTLNFRAMNHNHRLLEL